MVVKMRSGESNNSAAIDPPLATDLQLPVFTAPQHEHWPSPMLWVDAVQLFARARADYMRQFDSPEERCRGKNPARFTLTSES
jgi:hypothetical protein